MFIPDSRVAYCALCMVTNDLNLLHISTVEKEETRFKKLIKKRDNPKMNKICLKI